MGPWYATREAVKAALDVKETARSNRRVDAALEAASRLIEGRLNRIFYPWTGTRYFDWPSPHRSRSWRLWLDQHELISLTSLTAGGVAIDPGDVVLYPTGGPPYNRIEVSLDSSAAFSSGGTHQHAVAITGTFGYRADEAAAGTLAGAVDASAAVVVVSDSTAVGVGDVIRVGGERMLVTGRSMTGTGEFLAEDLTAQASATSVTVTDGSVFADDETILIDGERMLITDIADNVLTVKRAFDGSVLAAHSAGAEVHAPRALTVERGALGTAAAAHAGGAAVARHVPPGPVQALCVALALSQLLQEQAGYARTAGSGEAQREVSGRGVHALWRDAVVACGRRARVRAV